MQPETKFAICGLIALAVMLIYFVCFEVANAPECTCVEPDDCTCGGATGQRKAAQTHLPQWPWFG